MNLVNRSGYPDAEVRALIAWTLGTLEGDRCNRRKPPHSIRVLRGRLYLTGLGGSCGVIVRLPRPERFPRSTRATRAYIGWTAVDWWEGLVGLFAHEATHVEQYRGGRWGFNGRTAFSRENECDRQAIASLRRFKETGRAEVEALLAEKVAAAERRDQAAQDREAYVQSPAGKAERLRDRLGRWERRAKAAQTRIRGLRRKLRRYDRLAAEASGLQVERKTRLAGLLERWEGRGRAAGRRIARLYRRIRGLERSAQRRGEAAGDGA